MGPHTSTALLAASLLASFAFAQRHELVKLLPNDGSQDDSFGIAVAIDDESVLVGAYGANPHGFLSGAAYVFDTSTGAQRFKIVPSDGEDVDEFGHAAALAGEIALIGAPLCDDVAHNAGAAYLFDIASGPRELAKLLPWDGSADAQFGYSLAMSGPHAIVTAYRDDDNGERSGSAYLFDISDPGAPEPVAKLIPDDPDPGDEFGLAVAMSGDTIVIGVPNDDNANGEDAGAAYIFDALSGAQRLKLTAPGGLPHDWFGDCVAIDGDLAVVGAPADYLADRPGAAYVFDARTGGLIATLSPRDALSRDRFGQSVAISGGTALAGAMIYTDHGISGAAYLFDAATGAQLAKLLPTEGAEVTSFAITAAMRARLAVLGAWLDDPNGELSGSAYVFSACTADINGDATLDTRDIIAFLNLWAAGEADADWSGDGSVDSADVTAFLNEWVVGC
jgi:hypothetical protein